MDFKIRDLSDKWFSEATPTNYACATAEIGSGTNGKVIITSSNVTDDTTIEIVIAEAKSTALSAALASGTITITLGTTADDIVTADDTKNTATLIATAISKIDGYDADASGTGATAISAATTEDVTFTDGSYGTPCPEAGLGLVNSGTYYVCTTADNTKYNDNWKTFTLSSI